MPCILVINLGLLHLSITHSTLQQCLYCKRSTEIQSCKTAQEVHFTACHALLHWAVAVQHVAPPANVEAKQGPRYKLTEFLFLSFLTFLSCHDALLHPLRHALPDESCTVIWTIKCPMSHAPPYEECTALLLMHCSIDKKRLRLLASV